jgi:hypothetical protein
MAQQFRQARAICEEEKDLIAKLAISLSFFSPNKVY